MIRIWPRKPHDVHTSGKRRTDEVNDVVTTSSNDAASPMTSSTRAHRYSKGGSLDSRYSGDAVGKSYPHLVFSQQSGLVIPYVSADNGSRQRSQQQQLLPQQLPPQQQQQQQSSSHKGNKSLSNKVIIFFTAKNYYLKKDKVTKINSTNI